MKEGEKRKERKGEKREKERERERMRQSTFQSQGVLNGKVIHAELIEYTLHLYINAEGERSL